MRVKYDKCTRRNALDSSRAIFGASAAQHVVLALGMSHQLRPCADERDARLMTFRQCARLHKPVRTGHKHYGSLRSVNFATGPRLMQALVCGAHRRADTRLQHFSRRLMSGGLASPSHRLSPCELLHEEVHAVAGVGQQLQVQQLIADWQSAQLVDVGEEFAELICLLCARA